MKEREYKKLRGFGAFGTSLLLAACGTGNITPEQRTPEPQNHYIDSTEGEVLGISDRPIAELFGEFEAKFNNQFVDFDKFYGNQCVDLANEWAKTLGLPQFKVGWAEEMFGKYPDLYRSVQAGEEIPKVGDIMVWDNDTGGHTGISTGKFDSEGAAIVFEQNDGLGSPSHEKSYYLVDSTYKGFLRPIAYETPPTTGEILDEYVKAEGSDVEKQILAKGLRFWLETYTTKKDKTEIYAPNPDRDYKGNYLQVDTNIDEWVKEVPYMLSGETQNSYDGNMTPGIDQVFEATCTWSGDEDKKTYIELKNFRMAYYSNTNFSEADIENGWERIENMSVFFIYRTKENEEDWSEWDDYNRYHAQYQYAVKNGDITMTTRNEYFGSGPLNESTDPEEEVPFC